MTFFAENLILNFRYNYYGVIVTKRIFSFVLAIFVIFNITIPVFAGQTLIWGDSDGNGVVDITDAKIVLSLACGISVPADECDCIFDMDFDSEITSTDARMVLGVAADISPEETVHLSDWRENVAPTCTEEGSVTAYCEEKGAYITKNIPPKGHTRIEATCTECAYCSDCEEILSEPLGHTVFDGFCERCRKIVEGKESVYVYGAYVEFGAAATKITNMFGKPTEIIDASDEKINLQHYVYADDYSKLTIFTVSGNEGVIGVYSVSDDFKIIASETVSYDNVGFNKYVDDLTVIGYKDKLSEWGYYGIYATTDIASSYINAGSDFESCEKLIFHLTNSCRGLNGVAPVEYSKRVSKAARSHSVDMANNDYFSHESLSGASVVDRLDKYGVSYNAYGENIAAGQRMTVYDFNNGWYNSSGHRKNMLNPVFTHIGLGMAYNENSTYDCYVTQDYTREEN